MTMIPGTKLAERMPDTNGGPWKELADDGNGPIHSMRKAAHTAGGLARGRTIAQMPKR